MAREAVIGELKVRYGADTREFDRKADRVERRLRGMASKLKSAFAVGAIVVGITKLIGAVNSAIDTFDNLAKMADRVGIASSTLQELRIAADLAGSSMSGFDKAISMFNIRLGELKTKVSSQLSTALKDLDEGLIESLRSSKDTEEGLQILFEAIDKQPEAATRAALAYAAFGRSGRDMILMLKNGNKGLEATRQQIRDLGLVMDSNLLRRSEELKDQMTLATGVINLQFKQAFVDLAPAIVAVAGFIGDVARAINRMLDEFRSVETVSMRGLKREIGDVSAELQALVRARNNLAIEAAVDAQRKGLSEVTEFYSKELTQLNADIEKTGAKFKELVAEMKRRETAAKPPEFMDRGDAPTYDPGAAEREAAAARLEAQKEAAIAEEEARQMAIARRLEMVEESLKTETQLIQDAHQERLNVISAALAEGHILDKDARDLRIASAEWESEELRAIEERNAAMRRAGLNAQLNNMKSTLGDMASTLEAFGMKNHAITKAFAASDALISTFQAVAKAQSAYAPPLSWAMMAIAFTNGMMQVASIMRTPPKGGGGAAAPAAAAPAAAQAGPQAGNVLTVQGIGPQDLVTGDMTRTIADELMQFQRDGGKVVWDGVG